MFKTTKLRKNVYDFVKLHYYYVYCHGNSKAL